MARTEEEMRKEGSKPHNGSFGDGRIEVTYLDAYNNPKKLQLGVDDYYLGTLGVVWNAAARSRVLIPWGRVVEIVCSDRNTILGDGNV